MRRLLSKTSLIGRWSRFAFGLALILGLIAFFISQPVPAGKAGEVILRNLDADVQTTALFYMELDRMPELERHLESMKADHH